MKIYSLLHNSNLELWWCWPGSNVISYMEICHSSMCNRWPGQVLELQSPDASIWATVVWWLTWFTFPIRSDCSMTHKPNEWAAVITCIHFERMPLVQVARAILENPEDKTKIHMIYANVTYSDILFKVLMIIFALFSFH